MKDILKKTCSREWMEFLDFHAKKLHKKANEMILKEADNVLGLYIIETGRVKVTARGHDGEEKVIRFATDGEIVGHRGIGGDWTYPVNAICYTDTILQFIPLRLLNMLIKNNSSFAYQLIMLFAEELRSSEENNLQNTVKQRISKVILLNAKVFGMDVNTPTRLSFTIPRKDIASKAQTTYESVIRTLKELNTEKIIKLEKKDIHIINLTKLTQLANSSQPN